MELGISAPEPRENSRGSNCCSGVPMASNLARVRIILHGFGDPSALRMPVARTDYESRLMAAKMSPNRLPELGVEDQLELA